MLRTVFLLGTLLVLMLPPLACRLNALTWMPGNARNTGLDQIKAHDIYSICTKEMSLLLGGAEVNVSRKLVKQAQMPP